MKNRFPDQSQFGEVTETIKSRENGPFQFFVEGRRDLHVSGLKEEESFEATIAPEGGEPTRLWWSRTSQRPIGNYPSDWPFIPNVETTICEAGGDDRNLRVAVWTTGSQADVVDELIRQCIDSGWEQLSSSRALTKFRSGDVERLISCFPFGPLKQQVTLFERS